MLPVNLCVVSNGWYAVVAYWLPQSEWCSKPALGVRWRIAIVSTRCVITGEPSLQRPVDHSAGVEIEDHRLIMRSI